MLIVFVFVQTFEKKIRTYVNSLGWKTSLGIEEKIVYRYGKTREDDNNVWNATRAFCRRERNIRTYTIILFIMIK